VEVSALDLIGLGAEIEVLEPTSLREAIRDLAARIGALHTAKERP
jgi:predicted DNA-binding transcriptional regulator YafY